ncbi:MAG: hypothetical protein DLM62_02100 [Pseudonocardiales bacterium]|nr:MAG: hypothetical protein DLM62_02100 [Pseudonocardiales bacterium]
MFIPTPQPTQSPELFRGVGVRLLSDPAWPRWDAGCAKLLVGQVDPDIGSVVIASIRRNPRQSARVAAGMPLAWGGPPDDRG